MNLESFEQFTFNTSGIEGETDYLTECLESILVAIELPAAVELEIIEMSLGINGATTAAHTKPATLKTGIEVHVPEYIENGDIIKVNTSTNKFISRT